MRNYTTLVKMDMSVRLVNALSNYFDKNLFIHEIELNELAKVDVYRLADIGGVGRLTICEFINFLDDNNLNVNKIKLSFLLKTNKKSRSRIIERK